MNRLIKEIQFKLLLTLFVVLHFLLYFFIGVPLVVNNNTGGLKELWEWKSSFTISYLNSLSWQALKQVWIYLSFYGFFFCDLFLLVLVHYDTIICLSSIYLFNLLILVFLLNNFLSGGLNYLFNISSIICYLNLKSITCFIAKLFLLFCKSK